MAVPSQLGWRPTSASASATALEAVARATRQFVYVFSLDTDAITYRNRSVLHELGHDAPADLPVALWATFVHPDDRVHLHHLQLDWSTLADDAVREGEYRIRDANGAYRWFLARETVLSRHPDGSVAQILGALIDITESKLAAEALRERDTFLSLSQNAGQCGSWAVDLTTNRVKWSREFSRIYGLPANEYQGTFGERMQYVHPDDRPHVLQAMARAIETGEPTEIEYRIRRDDGEERVIWVRGGVVLNEDGQPSRILGTAVDITERQRTERALRESETLLRGLLETSPLPTLVTTVEDNHQVLSLNQRFTELFGYTHDDIPDVEAWWPKAYPDPRYRAHVRQLWTEAIAAADQTGDSVIAPVEACVTCKDGSERFVEVHMGRCDGRALVLFSDLTDRRKVEGAQRLIEALTPVSGPDFFRSVSDHLTETCRADYACVVMLDQTDPMRGQTIALSHRGRGVQDLSYDLRGTPCEEVAGKDFFHCPTGVQQQYPTDTALVDMGVDSYMGIPLFTASRQPLGLIALLHSGPIEEPERARTILYVLAARVTAELERALAERALRDSEARHSAILESSLDGLVVMRNTGEIVEFNAAAEAMFERRREDVIGLNAADVIMPEALRDAHGRNLAGCVQHLTSGVGGERVDMPAVRAGGTEFRVEISLVPIGADGLLLSAVVRDITDRLKLEEQLRQSQKLHAIGQLAGGVAHDFNNLLTVIMGYADAILSDVEPSHALFEAATHIRDAGERATLLTRQLLHFGRKAILEPRPIDLNTAIQNTGTMLRRLIGEDVTLATVLAPSLSLARVDRGQIEQVVVNLCLNARDAMPQGGRITIETRNIAFDEHYCRTHPTHKPGRFVELSIGDSGTGMTPDVVSHLFEPFFTTKGPGKGTGLGLATVYGIVQQAGGFITVDTRPGTGTVFGVFVPAIAVPESRLAAERLRPPPRGQETVLLVEDEHGVRRLARLSLERHGYTVLEAAGGREAIELAESYDGDIEMLVTDVVMPDVNGREVSERLRTSRPAMKVLYMSGYNDDAVVRHGVVDSAATFLQKPFDARTLATKVRDVLGHTE